MSYPSAATSSGSRPFTVALVARGTKAGVRTSPCVVCRTPARARVARPGHGWSARSLRHRRSRPPFYRVPPPVDALDHARRHPRRRPQCRLSRALPAGDGRVGRRAGSRRDGAHHGRRARQQRSPRDRRGDPRGRRRRDHRRQHRLRDRPPRRTLAARAARARSVPVAVRCSSSASRSSTGTGRRRCSSGAGSWLLRTWASWLAGATTCGGVSFALWNALGGPRLGDDDRPAGVLPQQQRQERGQRLRPVRARRRAARLPRGAAHTPAAPPLRRDGHARGGSVEEPAGDRAAATDGAPGDRRPSPPSREG